MGTFHGDWGLYRDVVLVAAVGSMMPTAAPAMMTHSVVRGRGVGCITTPPRDQLAP